jgi:hypothetical protein
MDDDLWVIGLRVAGALHFTTLLAACLTPIPREWATGLATLSPVHRRFAIAQNAAVGAVLAFLGYVSLCHPKALLDGALPGRLLAAAIALWWGGRLLLLPWLNAWPEIKGPWQRAGFICLHLQCASYAALYGYLVIR